MTVSSMARQRGIYECYTIYHSADGVHWRAAEPAVGGAVNMLPGTLPAVRLQHLLK